MKTLVLVLVLIGSIFLNINLSHAQEDESEVPHSDENDSINDVENFAITEDLTAHGPWKEKEIQNNAQTSGEEFWNFFSSHRKEVTELITSALPKKIKKGTGSVLILGAGNCNDLDLKKITKYFSRIELVDVDENAIKQGLARQFGQEVPPSITVKGGIDVTGVMDEIYEKAKTSQDSNQPITEAERDELIQKITSWSGLPYKAKFNVVVSLALLSQIVLSIQDGLGTFNEQAFPPLMVAIRNRHLLELENQLLPGGTALLISDIVSDSTFPDLKQLKIKGNKINSILQGLVDSKNFFHGTNPFLVIQELQKNEDIKKVEIEELWKWEWPNKMYLVYAIEIEKK